MITVSVNGEPREVPENLSLEALLGWLKLPLDRVAVERNLAIVPRTRWQQTQILAGDRLEVVHFVGGGTANFQRLSQVKGQRLRSAINRARRCVTARAK